MQQFIDELQSNGITANTVDVSSKKDNSKWKTYYRSANYPKYGVLLSHEDSEHALTVLRQKMDTELANYKTLSSVGYDVPDTCAKSIEIEDHLDGSKKSAAIIVEHIEGPGPYKAKTGIISLRRYVSSKPDLKEAYEAAWDRLTTAAAQKIPMDLQVMMEETGRIVTIDPEAIKTGESLPSLKDL